MKFSYLCCVAPAETLPVGLCKVGVRLPSGCSVEWGARREHCKGVFRLHTESTLKKALCSAPSRDLTGPLWQLAPARTNWVPNNGLDMHGCVFGKKKDSAFHWAFLKNLFLICF